MSTFVAVNDDLLAKRIATAASRVVFVAPAVSKTVAEALGACFRKAQDISVTVVLDPDEEAYRIGYGDQEGLELLHKLTKEHHMALRAQPGMRVGLLLVDNDVLVWSPTPKSVEGQRSGSQANGVSLGSHAESAVLPNGSTGTPLNEDDGEGEPVPYAPLADVIQRAVGADASDVLLDHAEIGQEPFTPEQVSETVKALKENPPAPFDLARKTRVFSSKFQYVEFELRGAEWAKREIKLSSLLLNADVPEDLQDLFETRVKPYSHQADVAIEVPALIQGQVAYNREGKEILLPMTQGEMEKAWKDLRERYLVRLAGFGWLIRRADKDKFNADVLAFETVLKRWVEGFRKTATADEDALVARITALVTNRASSPQAKDRLKDVDIKTQVKEGIQRLRVTEPCVKLVFKEISWESTRDGEFTDALEQAVPAKELQGWFEVFTAARERPGG